MPRLSMSPKLYQERRLPADRETLRGPGPRSNFEQNKTRMVPLAPPLPTPDVLQLEGGHPPDAGLTAPWPHGSLEIV
jgi:hypothetical protein